ncbi:hypothetical protein E2C01_048611 [Portunus trituberculatus]|uniref:Uncharacterized protein n=1 Tax=Portunus trituberculatus TaxID=210409 RepID=A0A5B7GBF1_PORTR|nr:hypothetical protein [Portunus trituberculatus]
MRARSGAGRLAVSCAWTNFPLAATQHTPLVVQFSASPYTDEACVRSVPFLNHRESFKSAPRHQRALACPTRPPLTGPAPPGSPQHSPAAARDSLIAVPECSVVLHCDHYMTSAVIILELCKT